MVEEVLKHHPDVNATMSTGDTALSMLIKLNMPDSQKLGILTILIRAGANVNVRSGEYNDTPIFKACYNYKAVPLLAKAGADLNARDDLGRTPLMTCFDPDYLKALVAAGADLTLRNRQGRTAAEAAAELGIANIAQLLNALANTAKRQQ